MMKMTHELSPERINDLSPITVRLRKLSTSTHSGPLILPDGRHKVTIDHAVLHGVTRKHLALWFRYFIFFKVRIRGGSGIAHPIYHLWHPVDHINVCALGGATSAPLQTGNKIHIREAFNREKRYLIDDKAEVTLTIEESKASDMQLHIHRFGYEVGHLTHSFTDSPEGVQYSSIMLPGPKERGIFPAFIRKVVIPRKMSVDRLARWLTHNVEEVSALEVFLPQLYDKITALGNNWDEHLQDVIHREGGYTVELDLP
jgi:hypothetical protein